MVNLSECLNNLIDAKLSLNGFNAEDENNITAILNLIAFRTEFSSFYRNMATNWLYELNKPSRRFKKITP
jgi:chromodomain-helicase-DNA-binding protein 7